VRRMIAFALMGALALTACSGSDSTAAPLATRRASAVAPTTTSAPFVHGAHAGQPGPFRRRPHRRPRHVVRRRRPLVECGGQGHEPDPVSGRLPHLRVVPPRRRDGRHHRGRSRTRRVARELAAACDAPGLDRGTAMRPPGGASRGLTGIAPAAPRTSRRPNGGPPGPPLCAFRRLADRRSPRERMKSRVTR
jgi:hypothetical protein